MRWYHIFEPFSWKNVKSALMARIKERHAVKALFTSSLHDLNESAQLIFQNGLKQHPTEVDESTYNLIKEQEHPITGCDQTIHSAYDQTQFGDILSQTSVSKSGSRSLTIPNLEFSIDDSTDMEINIPEQ